MSLPQGLPEAPAREDYTYQPVGSENTELQGNLSPASFVRRGVKCKNFPKQLRIFFTFDLERYRHHTGAHL
jgi:hypothetical protein